MKFQKGKIEKAVIYCRVSSERQVKEGDGLASQETRCREYAKFTDREVARVFHDKGISGAIIERPAMQEMFAYLDTQRDRHIIIIDDLSRLARSMKLMSNCKQRYMPIAHR